MLPACAGIAAVRISGTGICRRVAAERWFRQNPGGDSRGQAMENTPSGGAQPLPDHLHAPALHAGFWRRVAAYLIDWLVLMPAFFVLEFAFIMPVMLQAARGNARPQPDFALLPVVWVFLIVLPWLYYALCESSKWQATPGKLALALRVTDSYGRRIGFGRATGRFFGKIISGLIFNIGYMMAG
ncbi:MAG: RDD family protein, partial [Rhodanobacteraceae bacterium]